MKGKRNILQLSEPNKKSQTSADLLIANYKCNDLIVLKENLQILLYAVDKRISFLNLLEKMRGR